MKIETTRQTTIFHHTGANIKTNFSKHEQGSAKPFNCSIFSHFATTWKRNSKSFLNILDSCFENSLKNVILLIFLRTTGITEEFTQLYQGVYVILRIFNNKIALLRKRNEQIIY